MFGNTSRSYFLAAAALAAALVGANADAAMINLVDTGFANTNSSGQSGSLLRVGNVFTYSYDAGASFDTLVVTVSRESGTPAGEAFEVTYDGVAMNLATGATAGNGVSIFYLDTTTSMGDIVLDFNGIGSNGVGIGIAALESDNGNPIVLFDANVNSNGTSISIDTADNSFTMWALDTNLGTFQNPLPNIQIARNADIGSNGYGAAYELVTTGQVGATYSYTFTGTGAGQAARGIAAANFTVIPEPGTLALLASGLLGVILLRRK